MLNMSKRMRCVDGSWIQDEGRPIVLYTPCPVCSKSLRRQRNFATEKEHKSAVVWPLLDAEHVGLACQSCFG